MHIYDFPQPLDYVQGCCKKTEPAFATQKSSEPQPFLTVRNERSFIKQMYSEYARHLDSVIGQVLSAASPISGPIHEEVDRETLAQLADKTAQMMGGHNEAEQALTRVLLLMELSDN